MTHSSLLEITYIYCSFATANMFLNKIISSNQNNKGKWGCLLVATIAWLEHAQSFSAMRAWMATQCAGQISTAMRCICTKSWHLCFLVKYVSTTIGFPSRWILVTGDPLTFFMTKYLQNQLYQWHSHQPAETAIFSWQHLGLGNSSLQSPPSIMWDTKT